MFSFVLQINVFALIKTKKRNSLHERKIKENRLSVEKLKHLENQIIFLWSHDGNALSTWIQGKTRRKQIFAMEKAGGRLH